MKTLTAGQIDKLSTIGFHRVDTGLYVQVRPNGAKSWVLRYQLSGRSRVMGLGSTKLFSVKEATKRALHARVLLADKIDPIDARRAERGLPFAQRKSVPTFKAFALDYIAGQRDGWKNAKHAYQWEQSLTTYAFPTIGDLPLDEVTVDHVVTLLRPIWSTKSETASRVRNRVERVLGAAEAAGHRSGKNPAAWDGPLGHMLPPMSKVQKVEHHQAVPYGEVPALNVAIAGREGEAAKALRFVLLTTTRSGEVRGARLREVDRQAKVWVIPAERTKAGKEHRVPLTDEALALLPAKGVPDDLLFPGARKGKSLSDMSLIQIMRKLKGDGATVHGLRSSFRDWAAEKTDAPREVVEACLAHATGNAVELAYKRTDFFEKRRELMTAWARFVLGGTK